jgi:hypothetical protein
MVAFLMAVKYMDDKENDRRRAKVYYWNNRASVLAKSAIYRAKHRDDMCARNKADRATKRKLCIEKYGSRCVCCGESTYEFLAFDHKNGGGSKHRRETGLWGASFVRWLIANNFPEEYQLLCHNCNQAKSCYGECPHERDRREIA